MLGFIPLAVIGPVPGPRFGLGRACIDCTESVKGRKACRGFAGGCIGAPYSAAHEPQDASSRITR